MHTLGLLCNMCHTRNIDLLLQYCLSTSTHFRKQSLVRMYLERIWIFGASINYNILIESNATVWFVWLITHIHFLCYCLNKTHSNIIEKKWHWVVCYRLTIEWNFYRVFFKILRLVICNNYRLISLDRLWRSRNFFFALFTFWNLIAKRAWAPSALSRPGALHRFVPRKLRPWP